MPPIITAFGTLLVGLIVSGYAIESRTQLPGESETTDRTSPESSSAEKAPSSTSDRDRITLKTVEDTLMACLAGIPKDASTGQKMLAEESCRRDHVRQ